VTPPLIWDNWDRPEYPVGRYDDATPEDIYGPPPAPLPTPSSGTTRFVNRRETT
jgi:hypothetical protein